MAPRAASPRLNARAMLAVAALALGLLPWLCMPEVAGSATPPGCETGTVQSITCGDADYPSGLITGPAAARAVEVARNDPRARALLALRRRHELRPEVVASDRDHLVVYFMEGERSAVSVELSAVSVEPGSQPRTVVRARGARPTVFPGENPFLGHPLGATWLWALGGGLLGLALWRRRRRSGWWLVDIGLLGALAASGWMFVTLLDDPARLAVKAEATLSIAYAATVLVAARCAFIAWKGAHGAPRAEAPAGAEPQEATSAEASSHGAANGWLVPTRVVATLTIALVIARISLLAIDPLRSDIGIAGATGAELIRGGALVYGNMPETAGFLTHGDTYGPLNYVMYVPAQLALGLFQGDVAFVAAARVTAAWTDLACVVLLLAAGRRFDSWDAGCRAALAWLAFPPTAMALLTATNDAAVAMFALLAVFVLASPVRRGAAAAAAAAIKFGPLVLLAPLLRTRDERLLRSAPRVVAGAAAVVLACAAYLARYDSGFARFWHATVGRQLERDPIASLGGLLDWPWLPWLLLGVLVLTSAALALGPALRLPRQTLAGATLVLSLVSIVGNTWWHAYTLWFLGPLLLVLVLADAPSSPTPTTAAGGPP